MSLLSVSGVMRIGAELSSPAGVIQSDRRSMTAVLTMQYGRGLWRMSRRRLYHCVEDAMTVSAGEYRVSIW